MDSNTVAIGSRVELDILIEGETESMSLTIVPDAQADFYAGFLGESTPLARAILGQPAGAVVPFQSGQVSIRSSDLAGQTPEQAKQNAARRQEELENTHKEIAKANALLFSLTVESKWGDYDPDGIKW